MLCPDQATIATTRFFHSQDQHHFRARGESHLIGNTLVTTRNERYKGAANLVLFNAQVAEHVKGNPLPLAHQPQKKMLSAQLMVVEAPRFFLCQRQYVTCQFREPVVELDNQLSRSRVLDDPEKQMHERIGLRLVSCASRNVLPLEVIGKIRWRKAVIVTNAISRELAFVDQVADGDRIHLQKLCYFLGSHKLFHSGCVFAYSGLLCLIKCSLPVYHS